MHGHTTGWKLAFSVVLNFTITAVEIIGGLMSGSLALLSDSFHNFNDAMAISISYVAFKIGERERNERYTFGYKRAEIIAAFINSLILFAVSFYLIYEAYLRFKSPNPIQSELMLVVAFVGLAANLITALLLHRPSQENMNIKSAYLHIVGDTVSSVAVIIGGFAILWWNALWIDPVITVLISLYLVYNAVKMLTASMDILMESSSGVDINAVKSEIEKIPGVVNAHHIHVWKIGEKGIAMECHVEVVDMKVSESERIIDEISARVARFGINHVNVQVERGRCRGKDREF